MHNKEKSRETKSPPENERRNKRITKTSQNMEIDIKENGGSAFDVPCQNR